MQEDSTQTYGLYIAALNTFMTVQATYKEFQAMLVDYQMVPMDCIRFAEEKIYVEKFDDFDYIVDKVSKAPFD